MQILLVKSRHVGARRDNLGTDSSYKFEEALAD